MEGKGNYLSPLDELTVSNIVQTVCTIDHVLTKQQEDPPEPVLTVKVASEVVRELDTEEKDM